MSERVDDIGFGGYRLIQDTESFCYGVDAVLLSDFAKAKETDNVADLGTGNGIVPLIIHHKFRPKKIVGLEKQEGSYRLALRNAEINGLTEDISFVHGDVKDVRSIFEAESFDLVVSNPPYTEGGRGPISAVTNKYEARHETTASLEDFIGAAAYMLKPFGRLALVNRPSRLVDIMAFMRQYRLEPKSVRLVWPCEGSNANIVLVRAVKHGGTQLTVEPPLYVRDKAGGFTEDIERIYERMV